MTVVDTTFQPGMVLDGRYRLLSPLGQGGMGTVWSAQQLALGREVAIKSIRPGRADEQGRLEREARLLASVHHPSIVQIHDFGRLEGGQGYVVMERVVGTSLESHLATSGPMPCVEAVTLMVALLEGLDVVHAAGIVHRDLKPGNVLLARVGQGADARVVPKLVDFGIARDRQAPRLTMEGSIVGTPAYMAPEQFLGQLADARADLWAVGATLYDMIAGEPPFSADGLFELMRKVKDEPPPFPRRAAGLDGRLWGHLTELLRKAPSDRPASAKIVSAQLTEWLASRGGPRMLQSLEPTPSRPDDGSVATDPSTGATSGLALSPLGESFDDLIRRRLG